MEERNILRHEKAKPKKLTKEKKERKRRAKSDENGKNKKKSGSFLKALLVILIVAAVTVGGAYLYKLFAPKSEEADNDGYIGYSSAQAVTSVSYKNSFIVITTDGIKMVNKSGDDVNENVTSAVSPYVRGMKEPVFQTNGKTVLIYDIAGKTAVLFNEAGIIQSYNYSGEIISGKMSDSGYFVIVAEDSGSKAAVRAYSDSGSELLTWYSGKGYVADASVHNSQKRMAVVTNEIENGEPSSKLLLFSLDNSEPYMGKNLGSNFAISVSFYNDTVYAFCENGLYMADKENNVSLLYDFSNQKMKHCKFFDNGSVLIVSENIVSENYRGVVFNSKGKMISDFNMESFLDIADAKKDEFLVIKRKGVFNITNKGKIKKEISCGFEVKDAKYFGGKIAVLSADKIFFE